MMATDERLGIVRFQYGERTIPLRFTWPRIDAVGRAWIVKQFETVIAGKDGCQAAMAELLVLASGGEISATDLLSEDGEPLGFETAFKALEDAWLLARFGPTRRPAEDGPENPPKTRRTWWKLFSKPASRRG